ncbi:MAG: hypothetical protein AAF125_22360 [Chloroflexota bacterium]
MNTYYLSIGSNTDPEVNLKHIVRLLRNRLKVTVVSPVYESPDTGGRDTVYLRRAHLAIGLRPRGIKSGSIGGN